MVLWQLSQIDSLAYTKHQVKIEIMVRKLVTFTSYLLDDIISEKLATLSAL